jgi:hypothetical protein
MTNVSDCDGAPLENRTSFSMPPLRWGPIAGIAGCWPGAPVITSRTGRVAADR